MAWKNYSGGTIRELFFRQDRPGAVLVLECASVNEAKKMADDHPLVKAGLLRFESIPLGPFLPFSEMFEQIPAKG